jgi:beta-lactam-binding protein with PASTA domain
MEVAGVAPGQVVGQNPPANASNVSAPKISLLVAEEPLRGAFVTPSFLGQPLASVTASLQNAGFALGKVSMAQIAIVPTIPPAENISPTAAIGATNLPPGPPPTAPPSNPSPGAIVVSQDPAAGEKVLAGSVVNLVVR